MNQQHPLLEWFDSVGIELHPCLHLEQDSTTGLSFYTSQPLPKDITIIQVPQELCITSKSAFERIRKLCEISAGKPANLEPSSLPAADWTLLYLVLSRLANELLTTPGEGHAWLRDIFIHIPYVSHIPKNIETPLHFSSEELRLLSNTPLVGSTERRLRETIIDYERATSLLFDHLHSSDPFVSYLSSILSSPALMQSEDEMMTHTHHQGLELWRWAESAFTSRSFPPRLIGLSDQQTAPILIPAYDTFNHARAHPVTWSSSSALPSGKVSLTINYELQKVPCQVYNNYGGKSNEEFLSGYGFTQDSLTEDTLALKLGGDGKTHYWSIPTESPPTLGESDGPRFTKSLSPCPSLLNELEEKILGNEPPPREEVEQLELYAEVLETLESLLLAKRKAFRSSQNLIDSNPPQVSTETAAEKSTWSRSTSQRVRPSVWSNITQYRKGQFHLLNHAVQWSRSELQRLADALDDLEDQ